jgi:hypothetical protein
MLRRLKPKGKCLAFLLIALAQFFSPLAVAMKMPRPPPRETPRGNQVAVAAPKSLADCEMALMGKISDAEHNYLLEFLSHISLSGDSRFLYLSRENSHFFRQLLIWYHLSAGYAIPPTDGMTPEDQAIFNMTALNHPIVSYVQDPKAWDQFTVDLIHRMLFTFAAVAPEEESVLVDKPRYFWPRIFGKYAEPRPNKVHLRALRSVLVGRLRKDNVDQIKDQHWRIVNSTRGVLHLIQRKPSFLTYISSRMPQLMAIRQDNWQLVLGTITKSKKGERFAPYEFRTPDLQLEKYRLQANPIPSSVKALPAPLQQTPQISLSELKALEAWLENPLQALNIEAPKLSAAQSALAPLREGIRLMSDALLSLPTPPEAKDLAEYWDQRRHNADTIREARQQVRLWHDQARAQMETLESISEAIVRAAKILNPQLDAYVGALKAFANQTDLQPLTIRGLTSLVEEADMMQMNLRHTQATIESRLDRQLIWLEALMHLETISALPQEQATDQELHANDLNPLKYKGVVQ